MWVKTYSKFFPGLKPENVWNIWKDVNRWPIWHGDFEYCSLQSEFKKGNFYLLKAKGDPAVKIELTEVEDGVTFTDCTRFFGATMYGTHSLDQKEDGVVVTCELKVEGPLRWLWIGLVANRVALTVPQKTDLLIEYAKKEKLLY